MPDTLYHVNQWQSWEWRHVSWQSVTVTSCSRSSVLVSSMSQLLATNWSHCSALLVVSVVWGELEVPVLDGAVLLLVKSKQLSTSGPVSSEGPYKKC